MPIQQIDPATTWPAQASPNEFAHGITEFITRNGFQCKVIEETGGRLFLDFGPMSDAMRDQILDNLAPPLPDPADGPAWARRAETIMALRYDAPDMAHIREQISREDFAALVAEEGQNVREQERLRLAGEPYNHLGTSVHDVREAYRMAITTPGMHNGYDWKPGTRELVPFGWWPVSKEYLTLLSGQSEWSNINPVTQKRDTGLVDRIRERLANLQIDVVARRGIAGAVVYSRNMERSIRIDDLYKFSYLHALRNFGNEFREAIPERLDPEDNTGRMDYREFRELVGVVASYEPDDSEMLAEGIWLGRNEDGTQRDSIVAVCARPVEWDPATKTLTRITSPICRGHRLHVDGMHGAAWLSFESAEMWMQQFSTDPESRRQIVIQLIELFGRWRWIHGECPRIIAGLVLATIVQSIWRWRPLVEITGGSSTGKTLLLQSVLDLLGSLAFKSSDVTQAGLTQFLAHTSRVALLDEFDQRDHQGGGAKKNVEVLRSLRASSRADMAIRGSGTGEASTTRFQHLFWIAGIFSMADGEADTNRTLSFELLPKLASAAPINLPAPQTLNRLGQQAIALAIWAAIDARNAAERLRGIQIDRVHARRVECLSPPVAMLSVALGLSEADQDALLADWAAVFDDGLSGDPGEPGEATDDASQLMGDILDYAPTNWQPQRTVRKAIQIATYHPVDQLREHMATQLEALGIRSVRDDHGVLCVFFYTPSIHRNLFDRTSQSFRGRRGAQITQILARYRVADGIPRPTQRIRFSDGQRLQGLLVPYTELPGLESPCDFTANDSEDSREF